MVNRYAFVYDLNCFQQARAKYVFQEITHPKLIASLRRDIRFQR